MVLAAAGREPQICVICNEGQGKYKCGKCTTPFCSVTCSRTHRENCIPLPPPPKSPTPPPAPKTRKPPNPFNALDSAPELSLLFERYPNLPSILLNIDAAMQPPTIAQQAAAQAAAATAQAEWRGRGGEVRKPELWNHDVSLRKGKEALQRARELGGKDGEAMREWTELVLKLVGRNAGGSSNGVLSSFTGNGVGVGAGAGIGGALGEAEDDDDGDGDVADLLRRQLAAEDAKIIQDLMRAEKALS